VKSSLPEFLYLYKKVKNSRKPKLKAILRGNPCPAYPAVQRCIDRLCHLHFVSLSKNIRPPLPFNQVNQIVSAANSVCQEAVEKLISQGVPPNVAEEKVKRNFNRVNNNSNLILNVEEICK
jgi:hypothetical protein